MGTDRQTHSLSSLTIFNPPSQSTDNMKTLLLAMIPMVIFAMVDAQYGGGCDWRECRNNRYLAERCCDSSGTCCDFANGGGNYGGDYNNRGSCIRDSDCSADLKCCYLQSGY